MTIDPLTRAELEHNAANASLMAERRRAQWRTATATSTRALALSREVRSWETQATSWTAVLALVDAAETFVGGGHSDGGGSGGVWMGRIFAAAGAAANADY